MGGEAFRLGCSVSPVKHLPLYKVQIYIFHYVVFVQKNENGNSE